MAAARKLSMFKKMIRINTNAEAYSSEKLATNARRSVHLRLDGDISLQSNTSKSKVDWLTEKWR